MRGVRLPPAEAFHQVSRKEEGLNDLPRIMEAVLWSTKHYYLFYYLFDFSNVSLAEEL